MTAIPRNKPNPAHVTAKAFFTAGKQLGFKQGELGGVIGADRSRISRIKKSMLLDPHSKEGELALFLISIARALYALVDGREKDIKHFMSTYNTAIQGVPKEEVKSIAGIVQVAGFLNAIRAKT